MSGIQEGGLIWGVVTMKMGFKAVRLNRLSTGVTAGREETPKQSPGAPQRDQAVW